MNASEKLEKEFFYSSVVNFRPKLQSQQVTVSGDIILGDGAGPSYDISYLCHEMAHLVEIDDARMRCNGWGLIYPEVYVINTVCCEPRTNAITMRELRVAAYQFHLLQYIGVPNSIAEIVDSFDYLPDTTYVPIEDGRKPYGKNYKDVIAEGIDIKESQMIWRINEVNKLKEIFTLERFLSEWKRKIQWLTDNPFVSEFI